MAVEAAWRTPSRPAGAVRDGEIAILHLHLGMRLAAQLPHRLDDLGHAAAVDRMVAAQPAAVGIERQLADAGNQIAVGDELAALALLAEADVFQLHQHGDGKTVVDRGVFDVLWRDAGFLEGARSRPHAGRIGQVEILAAARTFHGFAMADHPHQRFLQAFGDFRRRHDQRAAAIGDDAAIHPVQRIGDHRRVQHVLDGDDVLQHGMRIVLRVMRGRDLDPGQLLAGGAVVVHMAHRAHAIGIMRGGAVSRLKVLLGSRRARRHYAGARLAGQRDQRDRAFSGGDGFGCMAEVDQIGTAAGFGGVDMPHLQPEIVDHRPGAARRIAGAEIAVDVGLGQAGIFERALGDFGMQLRGGFVGGMPGRMLVNSGDVGLAFDRQCSSPLAFLLPSGFCGLSRRPWQARRMRNALFRRDLPRRGRRVDQVFG